MVVYRIVFSLPYARSQFVMTSSHLNIYYIHAPPLHLHRHQFNDICHLPHSIRFALYNIIGFLPPPSQHLLLGECNEVWESQRRLPYTTGH